MNERKAQILDLLTESYIRSAHPVPSGTLAKRMNLSSATIRNELGALEAEGYLNQPHTSAGRVPTRLAYRRYARKFLPPGRLPTGQWQLLKHRLTGAHGENLLHQIAQVAADLSGYAVVVALPGDDALHALEIHLSALSQSRVLAVIVLETGLVRQLVLDLDPAPSERALGEAESSLRQLTLPLGRIPDALHDIARRAEADLARTFRALAQSWPKLNTPTVFYQGLKYVLAEPESADPLFVRTLVERVEQPSVTEPPEGLVVVIEDALAAVSARLPLGHASAGMLMLLGPARMRYPQALTIADSVVAALTEPEEERA